MRSTHPWVRFGLWFGAPALFIAASQAAGQGVATADSEPSKPDLVAIGYEIFNREWIPGDSRSHGGDGLGPVYNDTSCVACHNSGGSGGAGPVSKNIEILSASLDRPRLIGDSHVTNVTHVAPPDAAPAPRGNSAARNADATGGPTSLPALPEETIAQRLRELAKEKVPAPAPTSSIEVLAEVHPGFRTSASVVLHKFGTDPNYESWRIDAALAQVRPAIGSSHRWRVHADIGSRHGSPGPRDASRGVGPEPAIRQRSRKRPQRRTDPTGTRRDPGKQPHAETAGFGFRTVPYFAIAAQPGAALWPWADRRNF